MSEPTTTEKKVKPPSVRGFGRIKRLIDDDLHKIRQAEDRIAKKRADYERLCMEWPDRLYDVSQMHAPDVFTVACNLAWWDHASSDSEIAECAGLDQHRNAGGAPIGVRDVDRGDLVRCLVDMGYSLALATNRTKEVKDGEEENSTTDAR